MRHCLETILDSITPNLIVDQLEKILEFLQSDQTELYFTNITTFMEQLLVNIVKNKDYLHYPRLNYASNGLSDVMYGILETTKGIFSLILDYETGRFNKKVLCYRKLFHNPPITSNGMILPAQTTPPNLKPLMARIEVMCRLDRSSLLQKGPKRKKNKKYKNQEPPNEDTPKVPDRPDDLSPFFKKAWMQTIYDFLNDDRRASLIYEQKTREEFLFLNSMIRIARSNACDASLPENCKPLAMKIGARLKTADYYLGYSEGKTDKKTGLRDVIFVKKPKFSINPPATAVDTKKTTRKKSKTVIQQSITVTQKSKCDLPDLTALSLNDKKPNKSDERRVIATPKIVEANIPRSRPMKNSKPVNIINFQPTSTDTEQTINKPGSTIEEASVIDNEVIKRERNLDVRTSKLLADMSTPLKSEKAMRMMKGMGWEGGALGTRGDGITEPIMPALGIPRKAGLGHTQPLKPPKLTQQQSKVQIKPTQQQSQPQPQPSTDHQLQPSQQVPLINFTAYVCDIIYEFVTSDLTIKDVKFKAQLCKNQMKFFRRTLDCFNTKFGVPRSYLPNDLVPLFIRIESSLHSIPDYRVVVNFLSNMRATLHKISKNKMQRQLEQASLVKEVPSPLFLETMDQLPHMVLKLIRSNDAELSVNFDEVLTKKQCEFVDIIVKWLNRKSGSMNDADSIFSRPVYSEIKDSMGDIVLAVKFTEKSFVIVKMYTNCSDQGIDNNNKSIVNLNDSDIIMQSDCESDTIVTYEIEVTQENGGDETRKGAADDEKGDETATGTKEVINNSIVKMEDNVNLVGNPDDFYECLNDLQSLFDRVPNSQGEKETKDDWENLEGSFDYNNASGDSLHSSITKRTLSQTDSDIPSNKKVKLEPTEYKRVRLTSNNKALTKERIIEIQTLISQAIDNAEHLTLLNCHGLQNGGLIYDCYDDKSYDTLKNIVEGTSDLSIEERNEVLIENHKMAIKINSYIDFNVEKLFRKIELYNPGLSTVNWIFVKKSQYSKCIIITTFVDDKSFKYISDANYSLFAGIDKIQLSVIWD